MNHSFTKLKIDFIVEAQSHLLTNYGAAFVAARVTSAVREAVKFTIFVHNWRHLENHLCQCKIRNMLWSMEMMHNLPILRAEFLYYFHQMILILLT